MAHCKQSCDSYFVESHNDRARRFRDETREQERFAKRQTQLAIAEELSQLASDEYLIDILAHMEDMESKTLPDVASIDIQTEIQWFMRPYLLDFLIEAHTAFGLLPETLFLTINLLDRYCSKRVVYKKHYQLVGCSALLIASKYGDRKDRVPTIKELKTMCCFLYDDDMFSQMEWHVLQTLDWTIGHPTIDSFIELALENQPYDPEVQHLATYISEIAMFQKEFISKRPSEMARTSLTLARCILNRPQALHGDWASQYEPHLLVALSQQLHHPSLVLSRKYASTHLSRVANTLDDFLARHASIARGYAAPPTPPAESATEGIGRQFPANAMPVTPTKPQYQSNINNGCPTPPITPTNDQYFAGPGVSMGNLGLPPTPTSLSSQPPQPQQYGGTYNLPSIRQIAPGF